MLLEELKVEAKNALIIKYEKMLNILKKHEQKWKSILNKHSSIVNRLTRFQEFYDAKIFLLDYKIEFYQEKLARLKYKGD